MVQNTSNSSIRCWSVKYKWLGGKGKVVRNFIRRNGLRICVDGKEITIISDRKKDELIDIALQHGIPVKFFKVSVRPEQLARCSGGGWRGYKKLIKRGFDERTSQLAFRY